MQLGQFDELGSGIHNVNKYIKAYLGKDNPQFIEGATFKTIIPIPACRVDDGGTSGASEGTIEGTIEGVTDRVKQRLVLLLTAIVMMKVKEFLIIKKRRNLPRVH